MTERVKQTKSLVDIELTAMTCREYYSNTIYEQYIQNIMKIEKGLVELRLQLDVASGKDKKLLKAKIKEAEESVEAMKIARKSMLKYHSSFETGLLVQQSKNAAQ